MVDWVLGTDFSHWQGNVDVAKMYDAGARYAIIKASDANRDTGWQWEDVRFDENARKIFGHGQLLGGCYHWLQASLDPKVAADFYLERYKRFNFHFPPVLDFEEKSVFGKGLANHYIWCAEVWLDYVHRQTGRRPIVYTANWFTRQLDQSRLSWMGAYPLWVATYPWVWTPLSRPVMPGNIWDDWTMWQYSADNNGRGAEFGVESRSIDLNWYKGNYNHLLNWLETDEPQPTTPVEGKYIIKIVNGNISLREGPGINFRIVGYALKGDVLTGIEERNGWYKIEDKKWVSGRTQYTDITFKEEDTEPVLYVGRVIKDTEIRDNPDGTLKGQLRKGDEVNVKEIDGWFRHDEGWSDINAVEPK